MEKLIRFIPLFKKQNILVIGDIMVDKFVWGRVSRISPEAPVPVVEVTRESYALGGAGNVANNLSALGGKVSVISVIGNDIVGDQLKSDLVKMNINVDGMVCDHARPTIIKTRIIASHQQVVRFDREIKGRFAPELERDLLRRIDAILPTVDAVIMSDYGKGVVGEAVLKRAIALAVKKGIPITVDPKIENFLKYTRVSCITPNTMEAVAGMKLSEVPDEEGMLALGRKILKKLNSESVLITRGEKGMTLFEPGDRITHIPTRAKEVFDVTGAGDTVISTFTLAIAAGAKFRQAAEISNFAAGIVVGKIGTATVSPEEIQSSMRDFTRQNS